MVWRTTHADEDNSHQWFWEQRKLMRTIVTNGLGTTQADENNSHKWFGEQRRLMRTIVTNGFGNNAS